MSIPLALVAATLAAATIATTAAVAQVQRLEPLLREAEALGVRVGCAVAGEAAGDLIAMHRADEPFVPASNQKLITAIAALQGVGPDFCFETSFRLQGGVLRVGGGGDPNLAEGGRHAPSALFAAIADKLGRLGVGAVRAVVLDEGAFSGPRHPAGWPKDQLHLPYCPPTGAFVLEAGCFRASIAADGGVGRARIDDIVPRGLPVDGEIRVVAAGRRARPQLRAEGGRLLAGGAIARGAERLELRGVIDDPAAAYRAAIEAALAAAGIALDPDAPARDLAIGAHRSTLAEALGPMLGESSNFHAEQVLRSLGCTKLGDGSFAGGARAVRLELEALVGADADALGVADGSGLSRANRLTPRLLVTALAAAAQQDFGDVLRASLPRPGEGTLRHRFARSPVKQRLRAKTGWIRGASALSGFVGRRAFVILMNYAPEREGLNDRLKALQEAMVEAIDGSERG